MASRIFSIGGMNAAIRARRYLARSGLAVEVVKIDQRYSQNGCQYGIQFDERYLYDVVRALKTGTIPYHAYGESDVRNDLS